jgi:hypothetical protein
MTVQLSRSHAGKPYFHGGPARGPHPAAWPTDPDGLISLFHDTPMTKLNSTTHVDERIADRLTVILGLLGLLRDGAFGPLSQRQLQATIELFETSEELRKLLQPLLLPLPPRPSPGAMPRTPVGRG